MASLKVGAFAVGSALAGPVVVRAGVGGALLLAGAVRLLGVVLGLAAGAAAVTGGEVES